MESPLQAWTFNEARYYLEVTPCPSCANGPLTPEPAPLPAPRQSVTVVAVCGHCRGQHPFTFLCEFPLPASGPEAEVINPTDDPSRIIDLGHWLSLSYSLIGVAGHQSDPLLGRRLGYQAALCLSEALKFYHPGEELPPTEAFFSPTSQSAFRQAPERFARARLLALRSRLPSLDRTAPPLLPSAPRPRRWYQFWKPQSK